MSDEPELIEGVEYEDEHGAHWMTNAEPITIRPEEQRDGKRVVIASPTNTVAVTIRLHTEKPTR